jgi:hypothetical protein
LSFNIKWNEYFQASTGEINPSVLVIKGVMLDSTVNKNGWFVPEESLLDVAKQSKNLSLRVDHSKNVRDIVGEVKDAFVDPSTKRVLFEAEVDDPDIIRLITKKRVDSVSIGVKAETFCSNCGERVIKGIKKCECKNSSLVLKNIKVDELSIVTYPAFNGTKFEPVSFAASVDKELQLQSELEKVVEEPKVHETLVNKDKMEEKNMVETNTETVKPVEVKASLDETTYKLISGLTEKVSGLGTRNEKMEASEIARKQELEEEENKKKESLKLEETIRTIVKEEISKVEPKKESKPVEEEEEEEKEECKKRTEPLKAGAKVNSEIITADSTPKNMIEGMWDDIKIASKKLEIII